MKYLRELQTQQHKRQVSLFFTYDFTIRTLVNAAWGQKCQFLLYPCAHAMAVAVVEHKNESLRTLINMGTDVNENFDKDISYLPDYSHSRAHLEVAARYNFADVVLVLLKAGVVVTLNILGLMLNDDCTEDTTNVILAHINRNNFYDTSENRYFETLVYCSIKYKVVKLLHKRVIISLETLLYMIKGECSQEITDLILGYINE